MSKKRNPQYAVKHESWSSNVHKSLKHYDRQRDKQVDLDEFDDVTVWDTVNQREVWAETVIEIIITNELEESDLSYDEMEDIVLGDLDEYLNAYGYEEV